jgi:hypothetical protein
MELRSTVLQVALKALPALCTMAKPLKSQLHYPALKTMADTGNSHHQCQEFGPTNGRLFASLFGDSVFKETEAKDEPEATLILENEVFESGADDESSASDAKSIASSTHDGKAAELSTFAINSTKKTLQDSDSKQTKTSKKSLLSRLLSRQKDDDDDESTESDWQSSTKSEPESAVLEHELSDSNSL